VPAMSLRATIASFAAVLSVVASPAAANEYSSETADQFAADAAKLAELLEGREAGEPVRCIRVIPTHQITAIDQTAYVFGRGSTIYVQRTSDPSSVRSHRALAVQRYEAGQMCKLDPARTIDPVFGFFVSNVFFEDFIPYARIERRR
jgi:hypothetical protein